MKYSILKNSSGVIPIYIQDLTSSIGIGMTGVTPSTSGITAYFKKSTDTTITSFNLVSGVVGTYIPSGLVAVSNSNAPGDYELSLPMSAFISATSGNVFLTATLYNIPNALPVKIDIQLLDPPTVYAPQPISEPSTLPTFPCTSDQILAYVLQRSMNQETCTATQAKIYKSDGTTVVGTATITDDGTTLVRGRFA